MRTKFLYCFFALFVVNVAFIGCKKELTVKPNNLVLDEDVFTDKSLINSVLARFYQSIYTDNAAANGGGQNNRDWNSFQQDPDDGVNNNGGPSTGNLTFSRDRYKTFDYARIRELNQFLAGIRTEASKKAMSPAENANFEAQGMFLRAYVFFNMVKTLGGLTIVEDKVFDYVAGQDVTPYRLPRNSEADCYKYIIDQCDKTAAKFATAGAQVADLGLKKTVNSAIANKWTALMLKARAAVYAASIAKYTPLRAAGNVKKDSKGVDVVGIPASMANEFYTTALAAAEEVMTGPYVLQTNSANPELAFYQATTLKAANTEVIWATDRKSPSTNGNVAITFTRDVAPFDKPHSDGQDNGNSLGPTLNLVEAFENKDGSDPKIRDFDAAGNHIFYDDVEAPFKAKDARLWGTVIWPYAVYRGTPVPLRAGELRSLTRSNGGTGSYTYTVNAPSSSRADGPEATGPNGPADVSTANINKTGFNMRKWVDETPNSGIGPNFSEIWWPRFRLSEAYLIAAEAAFELGQTTKALTNINKIRVDRGRIQPLTAATLTFDKIVNENRVEFAFEDHRVWDLIRWRMAHIYWNGITDDPVAQAMELYPYRVNIAGNPNNGKWVFRRARSYRRVTTPFTFNIDSYYSTITSTWVNPNNPTWVGNPYQTF